jgi:hypothetical protein
VKLLVLPPDPVELFDMNSRPAIPVFEPVAARGGQMEAFD